MAKVIGIDLGTTNCCVAIMDGSQPRVIENAEGRTYDAVDCRVYRRRAPCGPAREAAGRHQPRQHDFGVKRLIGRPFDDKIWQKTRKNLPFTSSMAATATLGSKASGEKYSPSQISAFILQKMKETAESYLGEDVTPGRHHRSRLFQRRPASGHQGRRQDCRSGSAADHQRADAAALAYGLDKKETKTSPSMTLAVVPLT